MAQEPLQEGRRSVKELVKVWSVLGLGMLAVAVSACGSQAAQGPSTSAQVPAGPRAGQFLKANVAQRTAVIAVDAGYNGANGGFNFDGYSFGKLVITVPEDYSVTVNFANDSGSMLHSVGLVKAGAANPAGPVIAGAATPDPTDGTVPGGTASFHFKTPNAPHRFELACLVPGHIAVGMYVDFDVTPQAAPSMRVK